MSEQIDLDFELLDKFIRDWAPISDRPHLRQRLQSLRNSAQSIEVASSALRQGEPILQDIEQYRMQMAGISTAAMGYWKEGESVHPDYDTPELHDVAALYRKYDALFKIVHAAPQPSVEPNFNPAEAQDYAKRMGLPTEFPSPEHPGCPTPGACSCVRAEAYSSGPDPMRRKNAAPQGDLLRGQVSAGPYSSGQQDQRSTGPDSGERPTTEPAVPAGPMTDAQAEEARATTSPGDGVGFDVLEEAMDTAEDAARTRARGEQLPDIRERAIDAVRAIKP